jgi:ATP-dependent 26S proteasome regulatory subunit
MFLVYFTKVHAVVGVLSDDADPMVTVMKLEKAPQESYADIGGLDNQIQEIKVSIFFSRLVCQMCIQKIKLICLHSTGGQGNFPRGMGTKSKQFQFLL